MSEDKLKALQEAARCDPKLQEQLNAAVDTDAVIAVAKLAGFIVSAEDLNRAEVELSDEELGAVAGGGGFNQDIFDKAITTAVVF